MQHIYKITLFIALLFSTQASYAAASKEENIGIISGAIIGGATSGPVGIVVGAVLGAKFGDILFIKSKEINLLQESLHESHTSVFNFEKELKQLNNEIIFLKESSKPELESLLQAGINMDLLFRTDESSLVNLTTNRLLEMAKILSTMESIRIQLDGFADERGNEEYNLNLSEKRVDFVRDILISAGIQKDRISSSAHGESIAHSPDEDSYALERKVSIKLFIDDTKSFAASSFK
tara:strand:+ start:186 stop:890 length:705 start_codon:yes stop_codon:yes gene_type:complete